ncbi:MAG: hypothetical protein ABIO25_06315 [Specibacter sp.]
MHFTGQSSWRMSEDFSWPLTVALHVRDALGMPAAGPFFVPPVIPALAEHRAVTGPELDLVLADEWTLWFSDLLADHMDVPSNAGIGYMSLGDRDQGFRSLVESCFDAAKEAANSSRDAYFQHFHGSRGVEGLMITKLVASLEKELRHKAAPFELDVQILPVEGFWLHRVSGHRVLISESARRDREQLRRLLGPVVGELAQ